MLDKSAKFVKTIKDKQIGLDDFSSSDSSVYLNGEEEERKLMVKIAAKIRRKRE